MENARSSATTTATAPYNRRKTQTARHRQRHGFLVDKGGGGRRDRRLLRLRKTDRRAWTRPGRVETHTARSGRGTFNRLG